MKQVFRPFHALCQFIIAPSHLARYERFMFETTPQQNIAGPKPSPQAGMSTLPVPSILEFQDYRKFLASWLECRKRMQSEYSGAMFAKKAGLASHTLLGMVIRGQRN